MMKIWNSVIFDNYDFWYETHRIDWDTLPNQSNFLNEGSSYLAQGITQFLQHLCEIVITVTQKV